MYINKSTLEGVPGFTAFGNTTTGVLRIRVAIARGVSLSTWCHGLTAISSYANAVRAVRAF